MCYQLSRLNFWDSKLEIKVSFNIYVTNFHVQNLTPVLTQRFKYSKCPPAKLISLTYTRLLAHQRYDITLHYASNCKPRKFVFGTDSMYQKKNRAVVGNLKYWIIVSLERSFLK